MSANAQPTTDDAQVIMKLYDLRREEVMRQSRSTMLNWSPAKYEDLAAVSEFGSENNAAFRQVSSYFEMAFGFARRGAVDAEMIAEGCVEGLLLFAKIYPHLARFREEVSPTAFSNVQWIVDNTEFGKSRFEMFQKRVAQMQS